MKISVYILVIVMAVPCLLLADSMDKDIQDSLTSVDSMATSVGKKEKTDIETKQLVKKYGSELIGSAKVLATEKDDVKRQFGLATLVELGPSDSVKQAFLDLLKNSDFRVRNDAVCALAKIDKDFARKVAVEELNATTDPNVQTSIIPLLGVIGDSNIPEILKNIEEAAKESVSLGESARKAREYLEYRLNLPTKEQQKSWADQAYVYWLLPKEVEGRYRGIRLEYFKKAELMAQRGHHFSLDFLKYHLNQKDPLAVAIISVQKDKAAINDLQACLKEDGNDMSLFKNMCRKTLKNIEQPELKEHRDPNSVQNKNGG